MYKEEILTTKVQIIKIQSRYIIKKINKINKVKHLL